MRNRFDEQLAVLNRELISMGSLCESAISTAARALLTGNTALAASVAEAGAEIDRKERELESMCLKLLLQQQPVAGDLRCISAVLKMVTDMERIGNQACEIAEILRLSNISGVPDEAPVDDMARAVTKMVTDSVDAFVKRDTARAEAVVAYDDVVDALFTQVKAALIATLSSGAESSEAAVDMLMIAKYFERIGDHAVNIAQWVVFSVTGVHRGEVEL